jgi:HAD superfamily hydrolase (TIGR01509 family)
VEDLVTRRFDTVLFDLDGTLCDTLPLIYESFAAAFTPVLGRSFPDDEIRAMFGPPDHQIIRDQLPAEHHEAAIARYNTHYSSRHEDLVAPFPGIPDLLADLDGAGHWLGVITGKSRSTALVSLELTHLAPFFRVVYAGDDVARQKPDPEAVLHALAVANEVPGPRAVIIGDSAADVLAGRSAGISTIGVTWGSPDHHELIAATPDYLVSTVSELAEIMDSR